MLFIANRIFEFEFYVFTACLLSFSFSLGHAWAGGVRTAVYVKLWA